MCILFVLYLQIEQQRKTSQKTKQEDFIALNVVWRISIVMRLTKIKISNSNVMSTLLFACITRNLVASNIQKQIFANRILGNICIYKPSLALTRTYGHAYTQHPCEPQFFKIKQYLHGHVPKRDPNTSTRNAIDWNLQASRRRVDPL